MQCNLLIQTAAANEATSAAAPPRRNVIHIAVGSDGRNCCKTSHFTNIHHDHSKCCTGPRVINHNMVVPHETSSPTHRAHLRQPRNSILPGGTVAKSNPNEEVVLRQNASSSLCDGGEL
ncbi:hypothetical protein E2C01_062417 [Portunus trituberculatus]|uniref:Uncharacterized protein n=1 Tax=Portunus trituberculatus TaxID=210409 RepID=A0A5B7H7T7_PORTR|nr:hypothetical protein [Portunus trituberculatus]